MSFHVCLFPSLSNWPTFYTPNNRCCHKTHSYLSEKIKVHIDCISIKVGPNFTIQINSPLLPPSCTGESIRWLGHEPASLRHRMAPQPGQRQSTRSPSSWTDWRNRLRAITFVFRQKCTRMIMHQFIFCFAKIFFILSPSFVVYISDHNFIHHWSRQTTTTTSSTSTCISISQFTYKFNSLADYICSAPPSHNHQLWW